MDSKNCHRQSLADRQEGVALIVTLMVLMLVSALMVGFVAAVVADTRASGLDRDQTQAYAAAHAGLEQITSDLNALFTADFSPTTAQINNIRATPPVVEGFNFIAPGGAAGSGYWVQPRFTDANGNPRPEDIVLGSQITAGPYQGFRGIITPYDITVTARSRGGAEVRMRRTLQTVAIPVFQFGMFSETDLAFHAGAEAFGFGGRVHTNGNLFLAAANGGSLTIGDRVTAFKEVIRTHLPNGLPVGTGYTGNVRIPTTIATNPANNVYRNLQTNEGSLTGTVPPIQVPISPKNQNWVKLSQGTYLNNIRNGDTGAKRLDLPLVADLDGNGQPDAQPIELIRRPAQNSNENAGTPAQRNTYVQRFFALASVRILLSDTPQEILSLPTVTPQQPVALFGSGTVTNYAPATSLLPRSPIGSSDMPGAIAGPGGGQLPGYIYKGNHDDPVVGGYIKIEIQRQPGAGQGPTEGVWQDVTGEVLGLGISGRNLADANIAIGSRWNAVPGQAIAALPFVNWPPANGSGDICAEPHPNAIIRVQRVRDIPIGSAGVTGPCGVDTDQGGDITASTINPGGILAVSQNEHDYWPLALYDTREAQTRDGLANGTDLTMSGIIHYVELDVNNLRRWLAGNFALAPFGAPSGPLAKNDNGYIVYFSDRRNNKNAGGVETGEYGFEDVTNPGVANGSANGVMDGAGCTALHVAGEPLSCLEDFNDNHVLDVYGRTARPPQWSPTSAPLPWNFGDWPNSLTTNCLGSPTLPWLPGQGWPNPFRSAARVTDTITDASIGRGLAQQTNQLLQVCGNNVPATVTTGGPNWKALVARANRTLFFRRALKLVNGGLGSLPAGLTVVAENPVYVQGNYNSNGDFTANGSVPAAVIADAVTLLSNNWNDLRSFNSPQDSTQRIATTTSYRMAVITGKGIPFPQPAGTDASFGSDGGAHNFVRSLEDWDNPNTTRHRYRGSMVSFFINRQGVGTFKCCDQDAYNRGPREWAFDTNFLSPMQLPPGTPMFRDVNTLTFRQLLRPTQ
jgi:hypothetical protein